VLAVEADPLTIRSMSKASWMRGRGYVAVNRWHVEGARLGAGTLQVGMWIIFSQATGRSFSTMAQRVGNNCYNGVYRNPICA
jgi:hypothetical protein